MIRHLAHVLSYPLSWVFDFLGRLVLLASRRRGCRRRLGQVSRIMQQARHAEDIELAREKYGFSSEISYQRGTRFLGDGEITIGDGTYFGKNCFVVAHPRAASIRIGRSCAFSHSVHVRTASYRSDGDFADALQADLDFADIEIGDNVWVGAHVFIKGGVRIGSNSIVGANSVVTRDVPKGSIVGGVPAALIRTKNL